MSRVLTLRPFLSEESDPVRERGASDKEPVCQRKRCQRLRLDRWVGKIPWRRVGQPTSVFLPGESHGQKNLDGYSPWGNKVSDTIEATWHACI